MSKRHPDRRHSAQFELQLCQEIRSGGLGCRIAQEKYSLSATLIQLWLTQFDRGELVGVPMSDSSSGLQRRQARKPARCESETVA